MRLSDKAFYIVRYPKGRSVSENVLSDDIPDNRVPQDAGVVEVGQAGHVIGAVKLGRVDLANMVFLEDFFLGKEIKM